MASAKISYDEAVPLMEDYYKRRDAIQVELNDSEVTTLKGLRFSADDIRALLDQEGVTDLYLMFANSPVNSKNITIIAGGIADPKNDGGELQKELLYDYCEPCPSKCPNNM